MPASLENENEKFGSVYKSVVTHYYNDLIKLLKSFGNFIVLIKNSVSFCFFPCINKLFPAFIRAIVCFQLK